MNQRLNKFFCEDLKNNVEASLINELKKQDNIIVYGAGNGGKYVKYLLSRIDIQMTAFIDSKINDVGKIGEIPAYSPKNSYLLSNYPNNSMVIISVGNIEAKKEIKQFLYDNGFKNVIDYIELFNISFVMADLELVSSVSSIYYSNSRESIYRCFEILQDEISKSIYFNFIKGHALKNRELFELPCVYNKYFPEDIEFAKGYSNFVDCGAYNGETLIKLKNENIDTKTIALFEPDTQNFFELKQWLADNQNIINEELFLWPCGVWSKTEMTGFFNSGTVGSSISKQGEKVIQAVALDDVLIGFKPTFIKMDIEGGEYEALIGAKQIISDYKPDLAICVYHSVNHIWDIPLLIDSWKLNYKFYLRAHNYFGMATILYAVSE